MRLRMYSVSGKLKTNVQKVVGISTNSIRINGMPNACLKAYFKL